MAALWEKEKRGDYLEDFHVGTLCFFLTISAPFISSWFNDLFLIPFDVPTYLYLYAILIVRILLYLCNFVLAIDFLIPFCLCINAQLSLSSSLKSYSQCLDFISISSTVLSFLLLFISGLYSYIFVGHSLSHSFCVCKPY